MNIKVTGKGIICAIGNDAPSVLSALKTKKSGVATMRYLQSEHKELPVGEVKLSDEEMKMILGVEADRIVSRTTLMGAIALRQAVEDAHVDVSGKRVVVISGTTVGGMDVTEKYFQQMKTDDALLSLLQRHDCGSSTRDIADLAGLLDADVCTISTACSSAVNSIILGAEMLKADDADIVIAGGAEGLSKFHLNGFNTLMILDHEQCRPFDKTRAGLNLGEGAAFVVLEKSTSKADADAIFVAGYGNRCDAFHQTASSEDGEGAYLAMTDALKMADLQPDDIQYINAHGTGTPNNDPSESAAIRRVFGNKQPHVSSTKSFTGHTTSASGSIETVICVLAMQNNFVPASLGWSEQDENCIVPSMGEDGVELRNVICNSFGFGGNDSSLVLSKDSVAPTNSGEALCSEVCILADEQITDAEQLKDFREFISPMEARRMGKIMKAATLTSLRALQRAGVECPDAIITATAHGMLETTEKFLEDIDANGEGLLKPTLFMQSTHNTLGSAIAIRTKCHGYNITYSQGEKSLEWAMRDAERLIRTGKAETVLVGIHDESTPLFQSFCARQGVPVPPAIYSRSIVVAKKTI